MKTQTKFAILIAYLVAITAAGLLIGLQGAKAATVCNIFSGCTGTSTLPTYGKVLIGGKNGEYEFAATSTFGAASGAVSSVFSRTGVVTAQAGDYSTSLVTEGSNLYFTTARALSSFVTNLAATTSVASIITLPNLSLPYSQLSGTPATGVSSVFGRAGAVTAQSGDYTTAQVTESGNLYWTNTRFDNRLSATTSLPGITTLSGLSLPYSQVTGTPTIIPYAFPGGATSSILAFNNGLIANGSSTFSNTLHFTSLSNGSLAVFGGLVSSGATTTAGTGLSYSGNAFNVTGLTTTQFASPNISQWTNNAGYLTSLAGAASSTLLGDANTFSGVDKFTNASSDFSGTWQTFAPSHFQTALGFTAVPTTRLINTTFPLAGGGDLSADRTLTFIGLSTSTAAVQGNIPYFSGVNTFANVATTSATCTGNATCSAFTVIGSSPIAINVAAGTAASSTLLGDSNTFSGVNKFTNASSDFSGTWQTFSPSHFQVAGSYLTAAITAIGPAGQTQSGATQTLATSSAVTNSGLTVGLTIVGSGNTQTFTPTFTGSISGLSNANFTSSNISQWTNNANYITLASLSASTPLIYNSGTGAFTFVGLATTSQPSSSNVLTSNGAAGVYGTATSTLTASSPLTGSFVQLGSGGTLGCQTASGSQAGCLASADWTTFNNKQAALTATWPQILSGATLSFGGLSTSSPIAAGGAALYATGVNTIASVATSTPTIGSVLTYSGTLGNLLGGTSGTFSIANSAVTNAMLANSTISGVSLGGTLAALTATNATLTFSGSYTGTGTQTVGLNLANGNTWTGLQQFGNASTSLLATYNKAYFGATATTTIDGTGNIVIPSSSNLTITGKSDGCATFATGVLNSTGSACGSGGGSFPFTPQTYGNSTSSVIAFTSGIVMNGSTTVSSLGSGLVGTNNGLLYGFASSSLFGFTPASNARNINTTFPLQGGGNLSADLTLTNAFGTTTNTGIAKNMVLTTDNSGVIQASSTPQATAFFATSTTATSTFQGGFEVGTTTQAVGGTVSAMLTIANGIKAVGGLLINTWTNVTNAFTIKNAAGTTVFNVDTTVTSPWFGVGTTTPFTARSTIVSTFDNAPLGTGVAATSSIMIGDESTTTARSSIQMNNSDGSPVCLYVVGATPVVTAGLCN
jgi:hypothetical protein